MLTVTQQTGQMPQVGDSPERAWAGGTYGLGELDVTPGAEELGEGFDYSLSL